MNELKDNVINEVVYGSSRQKVEIIIKIIEAFY